MVVKKKATKKQEIEKPVEKLSTIQKIIAEARTRIPSERSKVRCVGCFNPRNTLTVKGNLEFIWTKEQIIISSADLTNGKTGVNVPCSKCKERRFLSLSKFSYEVFLADYETYKAFVLLKDDKFNALVGVNLNSDKTLVIPKELM